MTEKRSAKPHIAIVGAGNLAGALAVALRQAGYCIDQIIARAASMRAKRLAREVRAPLTVSARAEITSEVIWFCVSDGAIAAAVESLASAADWKGKVALHSSGALSSDEFSVLRRAGALTASAHPMMTFVRKSRPSFEGVPFALEGDSKAVRQARAIIADLGGNAFPIRKKQKAAYHAWGMFCSPLLCALLAESERIAVAAGVTRKMARARMLPILRQTLANYANLGAPEAFSGPIVRGDVETVQKHLEILRGVLGAREVYVALASAALRDLPAKNRRALREILKEAKY